MAGVSEKTLNVETHKNTYNWVLIFVHNPPQFKLIPKFGPLLNQGVHPPAPSQ